MVTAVKLTGHQKAVLRDFEEAVLQLAHINTAPMNERAAIKAEYKRSKNLIKKHIAS